MVSLSPFQSEIEARLELTPTNKNENHTTQRATCTTYLGNFARQESTSESKQFIYLKVNYTGKPGPLNKYERVPLYAA